MFEMIKPEGIQKITYDQLKEKRKTEAYREEFLDRVADLELAYEEAAQSPELQTKLQAKGGELLPVDKIYLKRALKYVAQTMQDFKHLYSPGSYRVSFDVLSTNLDNFYDETIGAIKTPAKLNILEDTGNGEEYNVLFDIEVVNRLAFELSRPTNQTSLAVEQMRIATGHELLHIVVERKYPAIAAEIRDSNREGTEGNYSAYDDSVGEKLVEAIAAEYSDWMKESDNRPNPNKEENKIFNDMLY